MTPAELIKYFTPRFNCRISEGLTIFEAKQYLEDMDEPKIDLDVWLPTYGRNLQRDLCWTPLQKSNLIISIFKGVKIPPLTIVQVRDRKAEYPLVWQVIDGKQRFTTVIGFLRNEFPIVLDWEHPEGNTFFFRDLPHELQHKIEWFEFRANMVYSNIYHSSEVDEKTRLREFVTDKDKVELYLYINYSGTQQEQLFMDDLANLVKN